MSGKVIQTCQMIKESGMEGCKIVFIQGEREMMREGLKKGKRQKQRDIPGKRDQ